MKLMMGFKQRQTGLELFQFAKHLHNGQGDRAENKKLDDDTEILLLEGWMLGFRS